MSASPRPQNLGSNCTVHYTTDTSFQGKIDTTFEIYGNQNTTYYFVFSVVVNYQVLLFQVNILLEYETGIVAKHLYFSWMTIICNHVLHVGLCQIDLPQATVETVGIVVALLLGLMMIFSILLILSLWSELSQYK